MGIGIKLLDPLKTKVLIDNLVWDKTRKLTRSSLDPQSFLTWVHSSCGPQSTTSAPRSCLDVHPTTTTSDSSIGYSVHGARSFDEQIEWTDPMGFQNLHLEGNLSGGGLVAAGYRSSETSHVTEPGLSAPISLPWEGENSYGGFDMGSQVDVSIPTTLSAFFLTTARRHAPSTYSQELAISPVCPRQT